MNSIDAVLSKLKQDIIDNGSTKFSIKLVDENSNHEVKQYKLYYRNATLYEEAQQEFKSSKHELNLI